MAKQPAMNSDFEVMEGMAGYSSPSNSGRGQTMALELFGREGWSAGRLSIG
jgi:hypothetical protein